MDLELEIEANSMHQNVPEMVQDESIVHLGCGKSDKLIFTFDKVDVFITI